MPDLENFVTQLSGVRRGQAAKGRVANVSGALLEYILGDQWIALTQRQRDMLVSESAPMLRRKYEECLRREYRTKEAARIAIKEEYTRLSRKYKNQK